MFVCLQYGALNGQRAWKLSRLLLVLDILGHEETRKLDYTFHNFNSPCTQNYLSGRLRTSGILVLYGINTYLKVTDVYANVLRLWQSKTSIWSCINFIYLEMQKESVCRVFDNGAMKAVTFCLLNYKNNYYNEQSNYYIEQTSPTSDGNKSILIKSVTFGAFKYAAYMTRLPWAYLQITNPKL